MSENKQDLIKILDELNYNDPIVNSLKKFITEYDGTREDDLSAVVMMLVVTFMRIQRLELKAKAFDSIEQKDEQFNKILNRMTQDYETIASGELPVEPSHTSEEPKE